MGYNDINVNICSANKILRRKLVKLYGFKFNNSN